MSERTKPPADIKDIFDRYSDHGTMTLDHLLRFLIEVQGEKAATKDDAEAIVNALIALQHPDISQSKALDLQAFFWYLFGDVNPPLSPSGSHDMNAPLPHYFIYTSHNSYLTGNQLSSDSSDAPIIEALQRGVRVIELDLWPNSTEDDVDVLHGMTLTNPVKLIQCLRSIKEYAFVVSDYPVVITLEDHLKPDLQAKVAQMLTQTFGDMLFVPESECIAEFASPEALKRRILISTKPPKEYLEKKIEALEENDPENVESIDREDLEDEEDEEDKLQHNAAPEYRRLIAIHAGKLKGGLKEWLRVDPDKVRRLSLSERELEKASITHGKDIIRFTQKNFLRVYPKGVRVDSSNYDPLTAWMHGAQMVAFNMQGYGKSLWLMQGMFRANGGCGYVKKPDFLLKLGPNNDVFDPQANLPVKTTLKVKAYLGEGWHSDFGKFDIYSRPDFYLRVGIAGVPEDSGMKETKEMDDNWNPTWNEEFEFPLTVPELALIRIEIYDYDMSERDDFGGQTCLPVSDLKTGIRAVPLHNKEGDKYKSVKLLMRFEFVSVDSRP
ncbi:hypothetical protein VitviT2T_011723 [Vitis vinifera]|uniref:Phosphoinositide phospholipase C n=2 Tax=Vitis vinifera TaxID=29760 RepID=D7SY09_VITVI|eukprot:XP_019077340.1 PREDICTED: phosphoinositide phospholipase C 2 [Vitis vinifera]